MKILGKIRDLNSEDILEVDGSSGSPEKIPKIELNQDECEGDKLLNEYNFERAPLLCEIYRDPDTKNEICIIAVAMFAGATNISFELTEDCRKIKIYFEWPNGMFTIKDIFKSFDPPVPNYHPRYLALENALERYRKSLDTIPNGVIHVRLPIPVQNISSTWFKKLINTDGGSLIVFIELTGYQKQYTIKKEDKIIF